MNLEVRTKTGVCPKWAEEEWRNLGFTPARSPSTLFTCEVSGATPQPVTVVVCLVPTLLSELLVGIVSDSCRVRNRKRRYPCPHQHTGCSDQAERHKMAEILARDAVARTWG